MIDRLGGITAIQRHVASMTEYLYNRMSDLRHSNGRPMLQVFGKHHFPNSREVRGFLTTCLPWLVEAGFSLLAPSDVCLFTV